MCVLVVITVSQRTQVGWPFLISMFSLLSSKDVSTKSLPRAITRGVIVLIVRLGCAWAGAQQIVQTLTRCIRAKTASLCHQTKGGL